MQTKTVITQWVHPEIIDFLSTFTTVISNPTREVMPKSKLLNLASDAHAVMVFMPDMIDDAFLKRCPDLKIVSAALKGYDNFDVKACTKRGIWFSIVPDLLTDPTAELAVGLLINIARNMDQGNRQVKSGRFKGWRPILYGKGIDGATVGIVGMGSVGRAVAKRLAGFNPTIIYTDPNVTPHTDLGELPVSQVDLPELFRRSDFLIAATPFLPSTKHLINTERLNIVKPGCYLINIGRGSCVDEAAVAHALDNGTLAGYAADVFEFEDWARPDRPQKISPDLLKSDHTFFTPHLGSAVNRVRFDIAMLAALNIQDALLGKRPRGAINSPRCAA